MNKKLLVCDLDNTLYDWVSYFVSAFYAMADKVVEITGCDREKLLDDFREVHRRHHDAEHPYAVLETETVRDLYRGKTLGEVAGILDPALHAFNSQRKKSLALYPTVRSTLEVLRERNVTLVAHTESKLYAVVDRMQRLELTGYFSRIYCRERPDSLHPIERRARDYLSAFPMQRVVELSHHQRKPNCDVLLEICASEGVVPTECAYIGDSMARDVLMAKRANITAIWAKYGSLHDPQDYERLVRISHWTEEDISRERSLAKEASSVIPDLVAGESFEELLPALDG